MNCPNCGAPLDDADGPEGLTCSFCAAGSGPDAFPISADRLVPRGQPAVIDCPHCDQRLMLGTIDERRVLYCDSCGGILVPMADFAEVVQGRRRSYRGADQTPRPLPAEQLQRQIACPGCARTMEVHPYYGPGAVVIDSCRACRLVWLDSGELARIERAPGRR